MHAPTFFIIPRASRRDWSGRPSSGSLYLDVECVDAAWMTAEDRKQKFRAPSRHGRWRRVALFPGLRAAPAHKSRLISIDQSLMISDSRTLPRRVERRAHTRACCQGPIHLPRSAQDLRASAEYSLIARGAKLANFHGGRRKGSAGCRS